VLTPKGIPLEYGNRIPFSLRIERERKRERERERERKREIERERERERRVGSSVEKTQPTFSTRRYPELNFNTHLDYKYKGVRYTCEK